MIVERLEAGDLVRDRLTPMAFIVLWWEFDELLVLHMPTGSIFKTHASRVELAVKRYHLVDRIAREAMGAYDR